MKHTLRSFFSIYLVLSVTLAQAQETTTKPIKEKSTTVSPEADQKISETSMPLVKIEPVAKTNDSIPAKTDRYGIRVGVDLYKLTRALYDKKYKGIELEDISTADKKRFNIDYGVKIKDLNNERLNQYADDLKGGIILNIGNIKADNVETVSKIISNIGENQSIQIEMITRNGQVIRLII